MANRAKTTTRPMARKKSVKMVAQEHPMGCGLACVAYLVGYSYRTVLAACNRPELAWTRGFYCPELVEILGAFGLVYKWRKVARGDQEIPDGSIVFVASTNNYPQGHFLVKVAAKRYMNPWVNCPSMKHVRAGFQVEIPPVRYVIYPA